MRILLDSNVLLRSVEPKHVQHQASTAAIDTLRRLGHDLAIVPQVLYEFWSVATRPVPDNGLGMTTIEAQAGIAAIQTTLSVSPRRAGSVCGMGETCQQI